MGHSHQKTNTRCYFSVDVSGCALRLLPLCKLTGQYEWQRTTVTTNGIDIRNESELYAKFPLGAAALFAELKPSGHLHVRTTVAGQHRLSGFTAARVPKVLNVPTRPIL